MDAIIRRAALAAEARTLGRAVSKSAPTMPAPLAAPQQEGGQAARQEDEQAARFAQRVQRFEEERMAWLADADRLREGAENARRAAEVECAAALAQAEQCGYAAGEARAQATAHAALQGQLTRLAGVIGRMESAHDAVLGQAEDALVAIVLLAVRRIVGEHAAGRAGVAALLLHALTSARMQGQLTCRIHPEDLQLLAADASGAVDGFDPRVRFVADPEVVLGGCVLVGAGGSLDARLETQLARLRTELLAVRASRDVGATP